MNDVLTAKPGWDAKAIHALAKARFGGLEQMFVHHGWPERGSQMVQQVQRRVHEHYGSVQAFLAQMDAGAPLPSPPSPAPSLAVNTAHYEKSTLRERIVEHVFIGEALRGLWRQGIYDVEVLRGEFDAHGYDLVMGRGPLVRHIQFKTGLRDAPARVSIATALADKPSGCVIWISVDPDSLDMGPFYWFGGAPGEPLPALDAFATPRRIGRTAKGTRPPRTNHRLVPPSRFERLDTLDDVLARLFGLA